ncbi:Two-component sensor histidine kinase, contains HisKA and HATPase domains [Pseudorhodobacter antarcticus]|jgi:two-component sensor histidine kinase|uniref:histidine kinase n=1 Tax=Pseudorhodobacter antarcticus TaxID=1077947 RepID=A0A1H8L1F8_9RHOB|nr:sensor histidine kinase [Pseudorhodobacter antarcticus]SEN98919.1 Two-component sensor histidine kinase, contains HisKA and HATPase domains [Pseudorhodobacter antarcticus]
MMQDDMRWWERVNARFALVLSLALLPLLVVSLVQTRSLQEEAQGRAQQAMLGATLRASTGEIGLIRFAQGAVAALASAPAVVGASVQAGAPDLCGAAMRLTAAQVPAASLVAFVPKSGLMTCSSDGRAYDYSDFPQFLEVTSAKIPMFSVVRKGPISQTSVLLITHPVYDLAGGYLGYTTIALPHTQLDGVNKALDAATTGLDIPAQFWTFDAAGEVLTASTGLDAVARYLPASRPLAGFVTGPATVFNGKTPAGEDRTFAMVPMVQGQLFLMSSWDARAGRLATRNDLSPYLLPVMMWAIGMIVAAWAAEWLVSRHVRVLTRAIGRFAKGDRRVMVGNLAEAPGELRAAGSAFTSMADGVMRGEARLEDTIHQKEVLLREVHHRVKNNLQLIASIMSLQMRKAVAPESKLLLKNLQDRIMGLATIHQGLYQTSGMADVRADELLRDIVRQIVNLGSGGDRKFAVKVDAAELHLTPDQAVPLSLFLTEAMSNAMKYAGVGEGGRVHIAVRLVCLPEQMAMLEVENSLGSGIGAGVAADVAAGGGTGLGEQLLTAFAQQLGGKLDRVVTPDLYRLSITFGVRNLTDAEDRGDDPLI